MKGIIRFNSTKSKYELATSAKKPRVLVTSKKLSYLQYLVAQQKHSAILKHKITDADVVSTAPDMVITGPAGIGNTHTAAALPDTLVDHNGFTIDERFEFSEELIGMVINKTAKSVLITGEGGVGKTFMVLEVLKRHGKVNVRDTMPTIEDFNPISPSDDEEEMEAKVMLSIDRPRGDYVIMKGYSTAKFLYRTLFENRNRTIIFDDCDSVLRDGTALQLLKSALDSYEERWISWGAETPGEPDLPTTFRFQGSVIFVSNLSLAKIDEAVKTRAYKVDVSMTKAQRMLRMYRTLENVMPDVDMGDKIEAINLMERNLDIAREVNYRALMNVISIRIDPSVRDWKKLAKFSLTEY